MFRSIYEKLPGNSKNNSRRNTCRGSRWLPIEGQEGQSLLTASPFAMHATREPAMQSARQLETCRRDASQPEAAPSAYRDLAFGPNPSQEAVDRLPRAAGNSKYTTRRLVSVDEIRMAQNLVYQVYAEEIGWVPDADNPSGIRVTEDGGVPVFVDDYEHTATWIGTFDGDRLIACWRWCKPLDGAYEIERYNPLPAELKAARAMEVNRLVIHPDYRTRGRVFYHLVRFTHQELAPEIDLGFCAVAFPYPGDLYLKIGLKVVDCPAFKYSPKDVDEVRIMTFDFRDQTTVAAGRRDRESRRNGTAEPAIAC